MKAGGRAAQKFYSAAQVDELRQRGRRRQEGRAGRARRPPPRRSKSASSVPGRVSDAAAVPVSLQGEREAVQRHRDLHGRHVHVHQAERDRTAVALRSARRRAESREFPGRDTASTSCRKCWSSGYLADRQADACLRAARGRRRRHGRLERHDDRERRRRRSRTGAPQAAAACCRDSCRCG